MKLPPDELVRLMGLDDSQWKLAGYLEDMLQILHQQRQGNINSKRGGYPFAARYMYRWTFEQTSGSCYDPKRKSLWYLGYKGPETPEDDTLDVYRTYHIIQKCHYLTIYADPKGLPSKKIMRFDMLRPKHRVAFLNVRSLAADRYPQEENAEPAKHRDLIRLQNSPRHKPRRREKLQRRSALAEAPRVVNEDDTIKDG